MAARPERRLRSRLQHRRASGGQRRPDLGGTIAAGKFQGVIAAATPMGWRITTSRWSARGAGMLARPSPAGAPGSTGRSVQ